MANPEHVRILDKGVEVWNRWREEHRNVQPELNEAYLPSRNLRGVNFQRANLQRAKLTAAHLEGANFEGANLRGAELALADLEDANLDRANLEKAWFGKTDLINLDLSNVHGLEKAVHGGPSTVGINIFYRSQGRIPEVFLRGCGVPEDFIQQTRGLFGKAIEFYSCFISYSHADKPFARRLHDQLQARGIRCWLDEHQLIPGDDLYDAVDRGIRLWDKVLLCCSFSALTSWWVAKEIDTAMEKERQLQKERGEKVLAIIPLNLDGSLFDWEDGRAATLRGRFAPDFTGWEKDNAKFEEQFERVVKALRTGDACREPAPKPQL